MLIKIGDREVRTLSVKELRDALEQLDDDVPVLITHPAHDRWDTQLASPIRTADYGNVSFSAYHNQSKVVDTGGTTVVLLEN